MSFSTPENLDSRADRMRAAIRDTHTAIEQLPFSVAMLEGGLTRDEYIRAAAQLHHVHRELENRLKRHPALAPVVELCEPRADVLRSDLAILGCRRIPEPSICTQCLLHGFGEWSDQGGWPLLGAVYVLEGSRLGSTFLARTLPRILKVDAGRGNGLDYHMGDPATVGRNWQQIRGAIDKLPVPPEFEAGVVEAGAVAMTAMYDLYSSFGRPAPVRTAAPMSMAAAGRFAT